MQILVVVIEGDGGSRDGENDKDSCVVEVIM